MPPTIAPTSLCQTCRFVRLVHGRRGQSYLLCRNDQIKAKYPQQPVVACPGYERDEPTPPPQGPSTGPVLTS